MSDTENESKPAAVPEAIPAQSSRTDAERAPGEHESREETRERAKKFLQDAQVQHATPERKAEFLKSKGLSESDIEGLLQEVSHDRLQQDSDQSGTERIDVPIARKEDRPPIVTYPEFLTKPTRPPPLVTINGFLNTLYAFGGLSALVYGASKYVVEPMVSTLTEARISLHETANQDLARLVSKLESTVSEIPPTAQPNETRTAPPLAGRDVEVDDAVSSCGDPTELFHRDIGVQTSPSLLEETQPRPGFDGREREEDPTALQASRLSSLVAALRSLNEGLVEQTESLGDVQAVLDVLRGDLDRLSAAAQATDFVGGFSLYGAAGKNEPDDEIRRAKENIRRVKGVLLSTRSFPASR